jgi:hypothetical protein
MMIPTNSTTSSVLVELSESRSATASERKASAGSRASAMPTAFSRFVHALDKHERDSGEPANEREDQGQERGKLELASLHRGHCRLGVGSLDDLLGWAEALENIADRHLARSLLFAKRRLNVFADLRDQLRPAGPLHVGGGLFEPAEVVIY